jgi:hypothetical protein
VQLVEEVVVQELPKQQIIDEPVVALQVEEEFCDI